MTITRAWQTALDFLDLDLDALDIGEALEQMYQIKRAMKALFVTNEQRERVRAKYRAIRAGTLSLAHLYHTRIRFVGSLSGKRNILKAKGSVVTIAACYLSSEGVVFGADSTSTMFVAGPGPGGVGGSDHHFNFAQKIFQIGNDSSMAMAMWGLGNLAEVSYRTLIASFADQLLAQPPASMQDVADRWNVYFWQAFTTHLAPVYQRVQTLFGQQVRTIDEENELHFLVRAFSGGFCLGGNLINDRTPSAFEIRYDPTQAAAQPVTPLPIGSSNFWGCPNLIERLIYGIDDGVFNAIAQSANWHGTPDELVALIMPGLTAFPQAGLEE